MAVESKSAVHGNVLVLDDKYAVVQEDIRFGRTEFEKSVAGLPFRFQFSSCWDARKKAYTVAEAVQSVRAHAPDAVMLDIIFGGKEDRLGLAILRELTMQFPSLPVIAITSLGRSDIWPECVRLGAVDYLQKPINPRLMWQTLDRYVGAEPKYWLLGQSPRFQDAVYSAAVASEGGRTEVMITGETGTGKELLARYIGRHGARAGQPFVPIHIAPMPADQQQAELFGAKKGAYTGAFQDRKGYFDAADKGIAFLDEIGDIDLRTQVNLLRIVESGEIASLGEVKARKVDVQIVSATNANLAKKIKEGEFRHDLWERLHGMPVNLPSLDQRLDDIPLLARHMLRVEALGRGRPVAVLPDEIEEKLVAMPWHGNVRELQKYAGRVFDLAGSDRSPCEEDFLAALPVVETMYSRAYFSPVAEEKRGSAPTSKSDDGIGLGGTPASANTSEQPFEFVQGGLQRLRLEEMALLHEALQQTRDPVTAKLSRAKAAALLLGKQKCSTNEFDRRVMSLWDELSDDSRKLAAQRYPDIVAAIKNGAVRLAG